MNQAVGPVTDLPEREPRLPRFAWLLVLGGVALAVAGAVVVDAGRAPTVPVGPAAAGPADEGRTLFVATGCTACHDPAGRDSALAPGLTGVASRAAERIASPDYRGDAESVSGYLEEAIIDHCADPLPGYDCGTAPDAGLRLSMLEVAGLVRHLLTLGDRTAP